MRDFLVERIEQFAWASPEDERRGTNPTAIRIVFA